MCLTADPGVVSSIPAQYNTFVEIHHEINFWAILIPSADSRRVVVTYKRKYVHEVLVYRLIKLAQEKCGPGIALGADWDVVIKPTKQTKHVINEQRHEISNNLTF